MMKKKKAKHLWHGVFAFFILLSFFGALVLLESQGSLITGFAVSEVSADSPVTATLGIGIPSSFRWQGQEYSLKASTISLGEGKVKLEVSKASASSAAAASAATTTSTRTGTTTPTATFPNRATTSATTSPTTTSTRTTTAIPTTTTRSSTTTTTALAKCQDKIDNDKDGKIDYPADGGCISLKDNDETDTETTTTSTRTTTTTPITTIARSTTTTTTSAVTGRATVATTTTAVRSPTTTTTATTATTTTTPVRGTISTTAVPKTITVSSPSKKLGDFELLKTEESGFDLDGDGSEDVTFTLLDVLSARQAKVEIKVKETAELMDEKAGVGESLTDELALEDMITTAGDVIYSNDLIAVKELLDDAGQPTASYEMTYSFNEVNKRIPFSFPCKPEGATSIEDEGALGGIADKIKAVYSYDADEKWLVWNPDGGAASNMQKYFFDYFPDDPESAQFFFGYYLVVTEKTELTITCSDFGAEKFGMIPGWNVFGIHGMEEKEAGEFLKETTEISEINEFKNGKIQKLSDKKKTKLQPGKVYWANLKKGINLQNPAGIVPGEGP